MEPARAKEILRSLADGRDPATGQPFPPNSPYQQADTARALFMALEAMEQGGRTRAAHPADPNKPKAGGQWSPEEEQQLRDAFTARKPIPAIAAAHGRTAGAITGRLMKLGLIENTFANRASQGNRPAGQPPAPIRPNHPISSDRTPPATPPPPLPPALSQEELDKLPF